MREGGRSARSALAALGAALLVLTEGCAKPAPRPEPELTVAVRGDVRGIYPGSGNESFSFGVNSNLFEGLTRLDRTLRPQPALAEGWENPDDETWIFHLRRGARFSDGSPVRAEDVVASIRFAGRRQPAPDYFLTGESVEALSPDTVRIRTRNADPLLLTNLASLFVLPSRAIEQDPVPATGSGPYRLDHWTRGKELVLVANPGYWGPRAAFPRLRFLVLPAEEDRIRALLSGEAQIAEQVTPVGEESLRRSGGDFRVTSQAGIRVLFLVLRMNEKPFSSPLVREAIDLAIDRGELVRDALGGRAVPAEELVPPAVMGYNPEIQGTKPDLPRARRLLAEAGYPQGFSVRLDGPNDHYRNDGEILKNVALQLGRVGIRVEVNGLPKERFFALQERSLSRFYLFGWSCETLQAGEALDSLIHSPAGGKGSENSQFLQDPALDRLIDDADKAGDLDAKVELLRTALARVASLRPILPLVVPKETFALSRSISWEPPLDGALRVVDVRAADPARPPSPPGP